MLTMWMRTILMRVAGWVAVSMGAAQNIEHDFSVREPSARGEGNRAVTPIHQIIEPEDPPNRIFWRAVKGSTVPHPVWAAPGRDRD
jgi:hypothetical protein